METVCLQLFLLTSLSQITVEYTCFAFGSFSSLMGFNQLEAFIHKKNYPSIIVSKDTLIQQWDSSPFEMEFAEDELVKKINIGVKSVNLANLAFIIY